MAGYPGGPTNLPTTIDATYPDDPSDPSRKLSQQHHDILHALANWLTASADPFGVAGQIAAAISAGISADNVADGTAKVAMTVAERAKLNALSSSVAVEPYPLFFPGAQTASSSVPIPDGRAILVNGMSGANTTLSVLKAVVVGTAPVGGSGLTYVIKRGSVVQATINIPSGTAVGTIVNATLNPSGGASPNATIVPPNTLLDVYCTTVGTTTAGSDVALFFGTNTTVVGVAAGAPTAGTPVSNAGADQSVAAGATVTLNGTGSSDPNGATLSYAWTQTGGGAVTLSSTTASSPTFTAPSSASASTLTFSLVVSNGTNTSAADTVVINVAATVAGGGTTMPSITRSAIDDGGVNPVSGVTPTFPSAPPSGRLLIAVINFSYGYQFRTVIPPDGTWTSLDATTYSANVSGMAVFYKVAGASETAGYTFTWDGSDYGEGVILEISGQAATNFINAHSLKSGTTATTAFATNAATPNVDNCLIIAGFGTPSGHASFTPPNGYTIDKASQTVAVEHKVSAVAANTAVTPTLTANSADVYSAVVIAVKP